LIAGPSQSSGFTHARTVAGGGVEHLFILGRPAITGTFV
jgi:hypothetical protein